jgi:branched-chain amino acid transport system permease protein
VALPAVIPPAIIGPGALLHDAVDGVISGSVFGILAMGVVVIYRTTRTLNLAQGGMATLGAFAFIVLREHNVPTPVAAITVVLLGALIGAVIGGLIAWPLRRATPTTKLVASLGILLVVQSLVAMTFGNVPRTAPALLSGGSVSLLGVRVSVDGLVVIAVCAVTAFGMSRLFSGTRLGLHMRAVAADPEAAALQGVRVWRVTMASWMLGVAIALGAGVLIGPVVLVVAPFLLTLIALQALAATLVGHIDSLRGALIGGLVLGELVTFAQVSLPTLPGNADLAIVLFILVVLLRRRGGLAVERA